MPRTQQRRPLPSFDARSVMLFAALTVGGALAQAQASSPAPAAQARYQAGPSRTPPESNATPGGSARPAVARHAAGTRP